MFLFLTTSSFMIPLGDGKNDHEIQKTTVIQEDDSADEALDGTIF